MIWVITPDWTPTNIIFYLVLAIFMIAMGPIDALGLIPVKYSKFRNGRGISSRVGMFILYFLPFVSAIICALPYLAHATTIQWIVLATLLLHFFKRVLEVLFLHRYSGPIDLLTVAFITFFYSLAAGGDAYLNALTIPAIDALFVCGIILFIIGEWFNYYHHRLLADLRRGTAAYRIPYGGWFKYVSAPHYLAELIAWLGMALMSRQLFMYLVFIGMCSNLIARALRTQTWYRAHFPNYPAERKAIFPFIL
jgi:hypothetical protein